MFVDFALFNSYCSRSEVGPNEWASGEGIKSLLPDKRKYSEVVPLITGRYQREQMALLLNEVMEEGKPYHWDY